MTTVDRPTVLPTSILGLVAAHRSRTCWLCAQRDLPAGAQVCPTGTGCRDGRIFHGPTGPPPHMPTVPCGACGTAGGNVVAPRRNTRTIPVIDGSGIGVHS